MSAACQSRGVLCACRALSRLAETIERVLIGHYDVHPLEIESNLRAVG
jgi:hypothetical protein